MLCRKPQLEHLNVTQVLLGGKNTLQKTRFTVYDCSRYSFGRGSSARRRALEVRKIQLLTLPRGLAVIGAPQT